MNPDGSLYIGDVWPGYTVFPDWLSPGAGAWWTNEMVTWHGEVPWDGIWIDMSEASSFCVGLSPKTNALWSATCWIDLLTDYADWILWFG